MNAIKSFSILYYFLSVVVFSLNSCTGKKIEITSEYIINENWDEIANSLSISRMKLKPNKTINLNDLNQVDVVNSLNIDSSFRYFANVKSPQTLAIKQVYFDKDNGFDWLKESDYGKFKRIGTLKSNSWYKISLDTYSNQIYIFLDSSNRVYRQDVLPTNY